MCSGNGLVFQSYRLKQFLQPVKDVFAALTALPGSRMEVTKDSSITLESLQEANKRFEVSFETACCNSDFEE